MEKILDDDLASRKGLHERYMKDVEEAVKEGLKMDNYERQQRAELRKEVNEEGHTNNYGVLLGGDRIEQLTMSIERLGKDERRKQRVIQ